MKTKREILKDFANGLFCKNLKCKTCPYNNICYSKEYTNIGKELAKIGAMAILRMFKKNKKATLDVGTNIKFADGKIYTIEKRVDTFKREEYCLRNIETMVCYPMDLLIGRTWEIAE